MNLHNRWLMRASGEAKHQASGTAEETMYWFLSKLSTEMQSGHKAWTIFFGADASEEQIGKIIDDLTNKVHLNLLIAQGDEDDLWSFGKEQLLTTARARRVADVLLDAIAERDAWQSMFCFNDGEPHLRVNDFYQQVAQQIHWCDQENRQWWGFDPVPLHRFWRWLRGETVFCFSNGLKMTRQEAVQRGLLPREFTFRWVSDPFASAGNKFVKVFGLNEADALTRATTKYCKDPFSFISTEV